VARLEAAVAGGNVLPGRKPAQAVGAELAQQAAPLGGADAGAVSRCIMADTGFGKSMPPLFIACRNLL